MELVRDFGDPHVLTLAEDHIVLKLDTAWARDVILPEGLSIADEDGLLLVANQRSLVSASKTGLLRGVTISKALFCGCASFDSLDSYRRVAGTLLRETQQLCIIHNRDKVYTLIRMFPNVEILALPHDLCTHALELDEPCRDRSAPLVERSKLKELVGSVGSFRDGCIILSPETTLAIMRTCPDVRRIDSFWVVNCFEELHGLPASVECPRTERCIHLCLLLHNWTPSERLTSTFIGYDVTLAAKFPWIKRLQLQVVVTSLKMLAKVSAFRNLRSLVVELLPDVAFRDVDRQLRKLLPTLPNLEELVLHNCGGLMLSTIARLCPKLKSLSVPNGSGSLHDIPVDADAFPYLEKVEIKMDVLKNAFDSLLSATHDTLRSACFGGDEICILFLTHCLQHGRHNPFSRLEHLTLHTEQSLRMLELQPQDLHDVLKALPALRHLQTDSYDLRLFFENYCISRDRLSLSWLQCVHCAVHNTDFCVFQKFCASFYDSLLPRQ
ncbi:uncharacterized protein LOC142564502 [Dermacentor variabilis]|uniref:uncharacterized protein LOC142564502 n=1 Tax=Dermacentor variabilis TaxID=34621 RepID=UPI003F5B116E